VAAMSDPYVAEVAGLARYRELESADFGPGYGPIESLLLHCVIRQLAPSRVVEIGSGLSTMITIHAANMNAQEGRRDCEIVCVEPNPHDALRRATGMKLVESTAQAAPDDIFDQLGPGDLLFLDSTHSVKTGSELTRLYLEIVPRLRPGVILHIHDIYLPYSYAPDILYNLFDWQETTLVAALLTGNRGIRVLASLSALHDARSSSLRSLFSDYRPCEMTNGLSTPHSQGHFPSSLWCVVSDSIAK
jgi:predicted O-methyltransferase YrrM